MPTGALVCRYAPLRAGTAALVGSVEVRGRERVPADLLLARAAGHGAVNCLEDPAATPYLLRLAYRDGVVWVRADAGADTCSGTSSGPFTAAAQVGDVLAASYAASAWTVPALPDAGSRCAPGRTGRAAQEGSLLPAGAASVVLCRTAGDGTTRRTATPRQAAVVRDVLAEPVAAPVADVCRRPSAGYEIAATYPSGPGVLVTYVPGCTPEVENGSLQAQLEPAGARRLRAVLAEAFRTG